MNAKGKMILAMFIFGSIGLFVRKIDLPVSVIVLARGMVGVFFLVVAGFLMKRKVCWGDVRKNGLILLLSGGAVGANWIFLFEAYKYTTIAKATLAYYLAPVFVVVASVLILKERVTKEKVVCVMISLVGMVFISGGAGYTTQGDESFWGIVFGVLAAVFYAGVILMNQFIVGLDSLERTVIQLAAAVLVLVPYTIAVNWGVDLVFGEGALVLLIVLGIVHTGLAYWLYFSTMEKLRAQTVAALSYIDPVTAILVSTLFLRERMGWVQVVGAVLILSSTVIGERKKNENNELCHHT